MLRRGQIVMVKLPKHHGSIISNTRPAIIVSNDKGNRHSSIITIIPITNAKHNNKGVLPTHMIIRLQKRSVVMCEQITTVTQDQVVDVLGKITPEEDMQLRVCLNIALGL